MTNWILIAGLGLGAYYLYAQKQLPSATLPAAKPMPITLQESTVPGIFEVPTYIVKRYNTPDYTTADTLYTPAPVFDMMPVRYSNF